MRKTHIPAALLAGLSTATTLLTSTAAQAQTATGTAGLEEVFVTARKRDEGVQAVPISIQALSAEALDQRNVREVQDLNVVVPGFRFGAQGGKGTTDVILRGLSKIPLGEGVPAVVTYFANVALPATGGNAPTYDIANIQVLKGPQGTLFGRNTLGGAVVIAPVAPTYELGGYVRGAYGTKNLHNLEGALNVPIVDDKVALRVAGQIRRQDGMNKNLSGGPDFDNIHQNSYRISLLLNPTDNIESTTIYDHLTANETASSPYLLRTNALGMTGTLAAVAGGYQLAGAIADAGAAVADLTTQINDYMARGHQAGIHAGFTDLADGGYSDRNQYGIVNDTSWEIGGGVTLRNILGYRRNHLAQAISSSGTGQMFLDYLIPGGGTARGPFILFDASSVIDRKYSSDELQLFGNAFDDKLDWIVGLFYNKDESAGPNGTLFTAFSPTPSPASSAHVTNTNKAIFAQTGLDISEWTSDGLKLNLGARYSKDDIWGCGGPQPGKPTEYMTAGECERVANLNNSADGVGIIKNNGGAASWTIGLDWQVSPDTLLYIASRHGYRSVNINTPLFESLYTTGGTPAQLAAAGLIPCLDATNTPVTCADLRPFQKINEEKITDVEVGVKNDWSVGDVKGRINIAAYITKYKDAVQFLNTQALVSPFAPDGPNSGSVGVNAADLTIKGIEADLTVVPVPSLTLSLAGAYTDQNVDKVAAPTASGLSIAKDNITLPSPKLSGTFAFNWTLPLQPLDGALILNGDYYHTDKFSGQNGENLPGYDVANFRLNWNGIAKSGLDVAVYLKNAFDEAYFSSPTVLLPAFPVSVVIPGDPRTWGVEATYRF